MNFWGYFKNGLRKPWTRERLKWHGINLLILLFGRRMVIDESGTTTRVLTVIWKKRLYLLGAHRHWIRLEFDKPCRLRADTARMMDRPHAASAKPRKWTATTRVLHVTTLHCDATTADGLVETWSNLAGNHGRLLLAYGGPAEEFERIRYPHKFFVPQSEIWAGQRGGPNSFTYIIREAAKFCLDGGFDAMVYTDGDAWPCCGNYLEKLCAPPYEAGIDFTATKLTDITGTSAIFPGWLEQTKPALENWVRTHSLGEADTPLRVWFHAGPFMVFSPDILRKFLHYCSEEPPLHDEVAISTYMRYLGAQCATFEDFGVFDTNRWLRYRPNLSHQEFLEALKERIPLVHPVKNNEWGFLYIEGGALSSQVARSR